MMNNDPTLSYQQAAARGASPIGQIVALYDTILRDFQRALSALKIKDIEKRVFELNHAVAVIGHLQYILDHERGGEAAKVFEKFYNVTRGMIVQANARPTPASVEELIQLYSGVRQAWYEADQKLSVDQQSARSPAQPENRGETTSESPSPEGVERPQLQWSA